MKRKAFLSCLSFLGLEVLLHVVVGCLVGHVFLTLLCDSEKVTERGSLNTVWSDS